LPPRANPRQGLHAPRPSFGPRQIGELLFGHGSTAVDEDDALGHGLQLGEDVTRDEHRAPVSGESTQDSAQFDPAPGVQAGRGLVEEHHYRVVDERAGQAEPLFT
jgi:hypothetical protein